MRKTTTFSLLLLICAASMFSGCGQKAVEEASGNGSIIGKVSDQNNAKGLKGVFVSNGSKSGYTDAFGEYALEDISPGTYTMICSMAGYASSLESGVVVASATNTPVDFALTMELGNLQVIVEDPGGKPISGAHLHAGIRATEHKIGEAYWITSLKPAAYTLTASKEGFYAVLRSSVPVIAGQDTLVKIVLLPLRPTHPTLKNKRIPAWGEYRIYNVGEYELGYAGDIYLNAFKGAALEWPIELLSPYLEMEERYL